MDKTRRNMKEVEKIQNKGMEITSYYAEIIVKKNGNSCYIYLPAKLDGKKVKVELIKW